MSTRTPLPSRRAVLAAAAGAVGGLAATVRARTQEPAPTSPGLESRLLYHVLADIEPPQDIGVRQIYRVTGGSFEGPRLRGRILRGGGDWARRQGDVTTLDVRATLETDDGHLIYTHYLGRVRATDSGLYFRITPYFETRSERYDWLNGIVAVGVHTPTPPGQVAYDVYEIL